MKTNESRHELRGRHFDVMASLLGAEIKVWARVTIKTDGGSVLGTRFVAASFFSFFLFFFFFALFFPSALHGCIIHAFRF